MRGVEESGIVASSAVLFILSCMKKMSWMLVVGCFLVAGKVSAVAADVYKVDPLHSNVFAKVSYYGHTHFCVRFNDFAGTITVDEGDPTKSAVQFVVKSGSIDSGNADRDAHLRGPDFFNAKEFPEFRFESTSVTPTEEPNVYLIDGNLTVLGVTRPAQAKFTFMGKAQGRRGEPRAGGEAVLTFKRSDFGMDHDIPALGDLVTVMIYVSGIRQ